MFRVVTRAAIVAVAALATASISMVDAAGVCYSPFYSSDYTSSNVESLLERDFQKIAAQGFDSVRTYHAQFFGKNVVNAAKKSGIKVAIGIQMDGPNGGEYAYLENDIKAAIWAAQNAPESVLAIYAGNENLRNGNWGSVSGERIVQVINRVKNALQGTAGANVPVGTVQRLEEWLVAGDAAKVAAASDVVGANIYPFFTYKGASNMKETLHLQWKAFANKYSSKARLTETGWPSQGSSSPYNNAPSVDNAAKYFRAFSEWTQETGTPNPFYFMMFDVPTASGPDFEQHFGVATSSGVMKFQASVPSGPSSPAATPSPTTAAPTSTPASTPEATTSAPEATTSTPAATTSTPAPAKAEAGEMREISGSGSASADEEEETPAPTEAPATPEPTTPAPTTPEPTTRTPEPSTQSPATVGPASILDGSKEDGSGSSAGPNSNHDIVFPPHDKHQGSGSSDDIGAGSDNEDDAGIAAPPTKFTPASTTVPAPTAWTPPATTLSPEKEAAIAAAEANSKVAREVSGGMDSAATFLVGVVGALGVAAMVVIGVYMRRRNDAAVDGDETRTVAASSIDPRGSTPSVYDDPLGTRFSSIVMITPNGDGVCIL